MRKVFAEISYSMQGLHGVLSSAPRIRARGRWQVCPIVATGVASA